MSTLQAFSGLHSTSNCLSLKLYRHAITLSRLTWPTARASRRVPASQAPPAFDDSSCSPDSGRRGVIEAPIDQRGDEGYPSPTSLLSSFLPQIERLHST